MPHYLNRSEPSQADSQAPELASGLAQPAYAIRKAGELLNLYRRADAQDPETYVAGLAAVLSEYSPEVVDNVCDPRTDIARRLKWLPTIAEIAEECDARRDPKTGRSASCDGGAKARADVRR